ncbi:MAG: glycosyltransferase [Woeseia sp.]
MNKRIVFVDPAAPAQYDERNLETGGIGSTEATLLRIAGALASRNSVSIVQGTRELSRSDSYGVVYMPYRHKTDTVDGAEVDAVIVIRSHKILPRLRRQFPDAALFLWMPCMRGRRLRALARNCVNTDTTLVAASDYQLDVTRRFCAAQDPAAARKLRAIRIYNPLVPGLVPDGSAWDPDKLLFLSSPHKGLEQVLDVFAMLKRRCRSIRLCIANPGYINCRIPRSDGVILLGTLPHQQVFRHLRDSLCLFYPQYAFAETFGMVLAEANAVGTPALAHPHGSAPEILSGGDQLCDCRDLAEVCNRVMRWRDGERPVPGPTDRFAMKNVVSDWEELLDMPAPPALAASMDYASARA